MFNVKLGLGLDVNVKLGLISWQVRFFKGHLGLDAGVKLVPVNCGLT